MAEKITSLETPPEVMAVFPLPERRPLRSLLRPGSGPKMAALRLAAGEEARDASQTTAPLILYVDGVQDPGNVGTLLRAAAAFGAAALATSPGCADLYGPKTVRAGMGAVFGLPLYPEVRLSELVAELGAPRVYGLTAHDGAPLAEVELGLPAVLVVGAERAGLSPASEAEVTQHVTIPLAPAVATAVESLNAGVAGAIALYEFSRRTAGAATTNDPPRRPAAPAKG